MRRVIPLLYQTARLLRDLEVLLSCDPAKWARVVKNKDKNYG